MRAPRVVRFAKTARHEYRDGKRQEALGWLVAGMLPSKARKIVALAVLGELTTVPPLDSREVPRITLGEIMRVI